MTHTYKGLPVPWIARWSGEIIDPATLEVKLINTADGGSRVHLLGQTPDDFIDDVLWLPERDAAGTGTPLFAQVQSHRQHTCQVEGRCQVCGEVIEPPLLWLIPMKGFAQRSARNTMITDVAPLCETCLPIARAMCPLLNRVAGASVLLEVRAHRPIALFGDVFARRPDGRTYHYQDQVEIGNTTELRRLMARQMVVELYDFRRRRL